MRTLPLVLLAGVACLAASLARSDDLEECIAGAKQANLVCWEDCSTKSCTDRCNTAYTRQKSQCRGNVSASRKQFSGTTKNGQDGCYYGECPPGLGEKIEKSEPERKKIEEAPPEEKERTNQPYRREPIDRRAQITNICQTPSFWCVMNQSGPINYPCWCGSPFGVVNGVTVPTR